MASRMGDRSWVNALNMLLLTLPGTSFTYYGEEIGMMDVPAASSHPQRTPMQWSDSAQAGFTAANSTWLPVADDYIDYNVKTQQAHGSGLTNMAVFTELSALRSEPSMQWGAYKDLTQGDTVMVYRREAEGFDTFLVALNLGVENVAADLKLHEKVPRDAYIVASTRNFAGEGREGAYEPGTHVPLDNIKLHPGEGIVVGWPYNPPDPIEVL